MGQSLTIIIITHFSNLLSYLNSISQSLKIMILTSSTIIQLKSVINLDHCYKNTTHFNAISTLYYFNAIITIVEHMYIFWVYLVRCFVYSIALYFYIISMKLMSGGLITVQQITFCLSIIFIVYEVSILMLLCLKLFHFSLIFTMESSYIYFT